MDIAAISIVLNQAKVQQEAGISVMKMVMDNFENNSVMMTDMIGTNVKVLEQSVNSSIGGNIDIKI